MKLHALFLVLLFTPSIAFAAKDTDCSFQQISKRIYVIVGSDHAKCSKKEIEHPLTNPAIIVGETGIIVIDPGSSIQVGKLVVSKIKEITNKPIVAIFNTHIHGLYWLGNQAIKKAFPNVRIYAHKKMIKRIVNGEGSFWVEAITGKYLGEKTQFIIPTTSLSGNEQITIAGVSLKIHSPGHAHTNHDIMIEVLGEKALFLGGIVVEPEVPSQGVPRDANFKGQIAATKYAIALNANKYIPGRGHSDNVELPKRALRFLTALYSGVERYYDDGLSDFEITERLKNELSFFKQWYDFSELGGVISEMYLQVEQDNF